MTTTKATMKRCYEQQCLFTDFCPADSDDITIDEVKGDMLDCDEYMRNNGKYAAVKIGLGIVLIPIKEDIKALSEKVCGYLNDKLGSRYKPNSENFKKLIRARVNEGFTEQDFYTVIDKKVRAWKDSPKMSAYLRPSTLFGTKFVEYLNEVEASPKDKLSVKPTYDLSAVKRAAADNTEI